MRDLRKELKEGKTLLGTFVWEFSSPYISRVLASCGWDFILVDTEHTSLSVETVGNLVATARDWDLPSIVRVPAIERPYFSRPLDAGAAGIMVPRIETPEEVEQAVSFIKFPPLGTRGVGFGLTLTRYQMVKPGEHAEFLNQTTLVVLQIETKGAVERMDEVLAHKEVDVAYVGPFDLSHSLGIPGQFDHPLMISTMEKIIAGCERHGVVPGVYAHTFEAGSKWMDKGMRFFVCSGDVWLLKQKSQEVLESYRNHLATIRR
jgi:2-keto-3-deoxy-L-rhamnonate aldolase RhmA